MKSMSKLYLLLLFTYLFVFHNCADDDICDGNYCSSDGFNCYDKDPANSKFCDVKCKPKYGVTERCFLCNSGVVFYSIDPLSYSCGTCTGGYILSSKECIQTLPSSNTLYQLGDIYYKECPSYSSTSGSVCNCENMYYEEELINGKKQKICLSSTSACPSNKQFYNYQEKKCYDSNCNTSTDTKKYETNGNIRCNSVCVGNEFYKELSDSSVICIDSCDRYIFYDLNSHKKYCKDDCLKSDGFRKKNNFCFKKNECDFYDDNSEYCLNSCEEAIGNNKHNDDNNKCIASCQDPYQYEKDNICYKAANCPFIQDENKCLFTCNVGEGFIAPVTETPNQKCYSSCTEYGDHTYKYFNHGENICREECSNSGSKVYQNECFSSCKDIDDSNIRYEITDSTSGYDLCYSYSDFQTKCLNDNNNYYITKDDGVKKCVIEEYCSTNNYLNIRGRECIQDCNYYKGVDNSLSPLKICFEELDDCFSKGYKYYNTNDKKCWKDVPTDYCKIGDVGSNGEFQVVPIGINNNYYNNDGSCVTSCISVGKFIDFDNKKKCIEECKIGSDTYYYEPINNECLRTCNLEQGFIVNADPVKICYSRCPEGKKYHNYDDNKCLENCDSNENTYKCHIYGNTVCYPSCSDIPEGPNGKYLFETKEGGGSNAKICWDSIPADCLFYSTDNNGVKQCEGTCDKHFKKGEKCLNDCDGYKADYDEENTINICLSNLDECFSNSYIYYNIIGMECWSSPSKIPDEYYIKSENEGKYEVITSCVGDDLLILETAVGGPSKCISLEDCKTQGKIKKDNLCISISECTTFIYNSECITSCRTGTGHDYYNNENKMCLSNCSVARLYQKENDYACFTSCNDIPSTSATNPSDPEEKYNNLRGNICSKRPCLFYHTIETDVKKCYDSLEECIKVGYEYLKENDDGVINECILESECSGFKVEAVRNSNGEIVALGKCFSSTDSCRTNGYYFYNFAAKECWKDSCKENFKTMQLDSDGHPEENEIDTAPYKETCVSDCPTDYSFSENYCKKKCSLSNLYSSEDNEFKCYPRCPQEKFIDEENKKCLSKCPLYKYHEIDSNICKEPYECASKIADYDTRTCVSRCTNTNYISNMEETLVDGTSKTYTICLNECSDDKYGTFISPDNECINSCNDPPSPSSPLNYMPDSTGKKCICKNLYYYDEMNNNKIVCLSDEVENCYDSNNPTDYKIKMYGTSQCVKNCGGDIPSLNGEICYKNVEDACKEDLYSSTYSGGKCVCLYKFYKIGNTKHCIEESGECPSDYSLYVPETRECVGICPSEISKKFKTFCLRTCPYGSSETDGECKCVGETNNKKNLWYSPGENSFVCLGIDDLCPDLYPILAPQTNECLKKCKGTFYPYLIDNKCYSGCSTIDNTVRKYITNDLASFTCVCKYPWYYESNNEMHCPKSEDEIQYCAQYDINLNYMIHDTKQCVEKCPSDYLYHFNQECFEKCEDADLEYNYSTKKDSYECQCKYLWYTEVKIANLVSHKKCLDSSVKDCTSITDKPFLIYDTNECVTEAECSNMFVFNMICYNKCPENTKEIEKDANKYTCACNKELDFYWYEYSKSAKTYFVCDVKDCPINNDDLNHNRPYLLKEKKQCLTSCNFASSPKPWSLRYNCVDECPDYTKKNEDLKKCEFYDPYNTPIVDKETLKKYGNVQAKELYDESHSLGGFLFNNFEGVSFHVYAIDKSDSLKEYATQSNLTYIDFGTCLPKLFANHILRDDDKILVVKYDLSNWNSEEDTTPAEPVNPVDPATPADETPKKDDKKYLINKVEYEFYNYRTMDIINVSLCDPYELIVSYPIVYNKNRFNNYDSGFNNNEYKKKFEMGKILNLKNNEVDTFNLNDSIYKELCTGIELYGKDIVFEDRYETLYPNGALLCESNCTYNNTDFAEERVNCKCAYKQEISFNREEEEKNDLVNDPNFHVPTQSSSNIQVMKCLKKLKVKDAIVNNEAFYYCAAVTALVGSMTLITAFYGIKSASVSISNISPQPQNNFNVMERKVKFDNNDIKSSQRKLNNPPKKPGSNINEDDDEDNVDKGNIIEHKNIGLNYNNNNDILAESNELNGPKINYSHKAEYLPLQYNFKFFKLNDKGVLKQIERNKLPFKVSQDTKYLLERKKGVDYPETYLNGPFYQGQNIVEIIDDGNVDNKKKNNNINNNVDIVYKSNQNLIDSNKDVNMKQRGVKNNLNLNMNMSMKNTNSNFKSGEKGEKDFITIKRLKFNKKGLDDTVDNKDDDDYGKKDEELSLYTLIKREQSLLRVNYRKYISKEHKNILAVFLAEILDKVYLVKTCLFLKKFEIFAVHFSLYLFCHLLLLTLSCAFFTTKVIKKRWKEDNYPGVQYYLLYGLITNVVVWLVYRIFLCLLDIQDKVKEYVKLKKENNKDNENDNNLEKNDENTMNKLNEIVKNLKCRIIIFYCVIFVLIILFALYLIPFFSIYTGTKSCVLLAYIYGIVEILLIKFIYGVCLAAIRVSSEGNELECLYKVVYILDKYIS